MTIGFKSIPGYIPSCPFDAEEVPEVPPEVLSVLSGELPEEVPGEPPEVPPEVELGRNNEHEYPSPLGSNSIPSITTGLHSQRYPILELSGIH